MLNNPSEPKLSQDSLPQDLLQQDNHARQQALNPTGSFIIQAPAGSGKTELLTQRLLVLLARVQKPEEVLAITFTRKAAGEMRDRILERLQQALTEPRPDAPHQQLSWDLAKAVLARNTELGWGLLESPQRLQLLTFDALSALLVRQMPWLSQFGGPVQVSERPASLYRRAAQATLNLLDDTEEAAELHDALVGWRARVPKLVDELARLLAVREHWAAQMMPAIDWQALAAAWQQALKPWAERLEPLRSHWPELIRLARFAQSELKDRLKAEVGALAALDTEQSADWQQPQLLPALQGAAALLLDSKGQWRGRVDARTGFKAGSAQQKSLIALLSSLRAEPEADGLLGCLQRLQQKTLCLAFSPQNQQDLMSLQWLLRRAYLELQWVFAAQGEADFSEISQRALQALGDEANPTDLALRLDARFNHILVDEFQDTSLSQVRLLRLLTSGWQADDGRSLLLVGDPMQSIYRFRQAEVSLFLQIQQQGLKPELPLTPLFLRRNFRSQAGIVDWVNHSFSAIFPSEPDLSLGGVCYEASTASQPQAPVSVMGEIFIQGTAATEPEVADSSLEELPLASEADAVVQHIQRFRQQQPDGRIAVLVRARTHLANILPALKAAGLKYQAVELEYLQSRQAVQDLLSLALALHNPADRSHWLAILRAPWCGLDLADLHQLFYDQPKPVAVWPLLIERCARLSAPGAQRLADWLERMTPIWAARGRIGWRDLVESAWFKLGGPASLSSDAELQDMQQVFSLLAEHSAQGWIDESSLNEALAEVFAQVDPLADSRLQLMTIHKSKGLEFDLVIVPGLAAVKKASEALLLASLSDLACPQQPLLAALNPEQPLVAYLLTLQKQAERFEMMRLLYVAATRAKQQLVLIGCVRLDKLTGDLALHRGSLWEFLWGLDRSAWRVHAAPSSEDPPVDAAVVIEDSRLWRYPLPLLPSPQPLVLPVPNQDEVVDLLPLHASLLARESGILCHRLLEQIARDGSSLWPQSRLWAMQPLLVRHLQARHLPQQQAEQAAEQILSGLGRLLQGEHRFLLQRQQQEAVEYGLTLSDEQGRRRVFLDRTFVDAQGVRWIVDYKTGQHQGGDLEAYLAEQIERYRPQLEDYAQLMARLESRSIRLALYFTAHGYLHEWDYQAP